VPPRAPTLYTMADLKLC